MRRLLVALLLVLCWAGRAEAITITNGCYQEEGATQAFVECGVSMTAGDDMLVACQSDGGPGGTRTITDGTHDASFATNIIDAGNVIPGLFLSWVTAAGSTTYTVRCTFGGNSFSAIRVVTISSGTFDAAGSFANGSGNGSASATISTGNGAVIGFFVRTAGGAITEDGTLLGEQETYTNTTGSAQYKTGSGSLTLNWTSGAGNWRAVAVSYLDAGGGGGGSAPSRSLLGVGK